MKPKLAYYYRCKLCKKAVWVYDKERAKVNCPLCSIGTYEYLGSKLVMDD